MSQAGGAALAAAYAEAERLARAHYENFPVASRLLPAALRRHVAAVYAFARIADDFADEPGRAPADRLARLDEWARGLHGDASVHPVFLAVADTRARFDLTTDLFDDLLSAFRQDVTTGRYETWPDLLDYCRRSANPVGRLVLRLHGYRDEALDRASDAVCTALQLVNFWQDLAIDWSRGRLYVPEQTWRAAGADPTDLDGGRWTPAWRAALADAGARTRELLARGRPVCDGVAGRLRYELRATWLGGSRILDRLERSGYDVFTARPALAATDALVIAFRTVTWRRSR
ncbi:MAG: squalene synthase HpnC [Acidobacteriota bacterium]